VSVPVVALGGDLSVISLFDLGQLLRLNGATGCLTIRDGARNGALYFDSGELINAVDDLRNQGEEAAIGLFGWRRGSFEFRAEASIGGRAIQSSTEAVMMEAARRLDEAAIGTTVEHVDDSETRRLQEHQAAMEALREAFLRVAGEANQDPSRVDALSVTVHLYQLTEPEDRLLYRPGYPPFLRRRGRWSPVPEPPLTREDFAQLSQRLNDACDPLLIGEPEPDRRRMTLANGRVLILDPIGEGDEESLWVRPSGSTPPGVEPTLTGDLGMLSTLVEFPESLLILGAAEIATTRRLLAATASLAMGPADTLLLVSPDGTGRIRTERGVSVVTTPAGLRPLLDIVRPDLVALDPALGPGQLSLDELAAVPRILASAVGQDPASLPARWVFRLACRRRASGRAWLSTMLRGVVTARASENESGILTVSAWALDMRERELALRGEIEALGARLDARAAA